MNQTTNIDSLILNNNNDNDNDNDNDTIRYDTTTTTTTMIMITDKYLNNNISYYEFIRDSINYFHRNLFTFLYQELFTTTTTNSTTATNSKLITKHYFNKEFHLDLENILRQINRFDLFIIIILTILFTIGRYLMTKYVFIPITKIYGINANDAQKIPESSWKLLFYLSTWITSVYYIFIIDGGQLFYNPANFWNNYSIDNPVDSITYILYMVELSFYLHSLYTTLMVDERRKDTNTLMIHHLICIILIFISYCNKSHKAGLITLFLHDGCDILLEATKLIRYFKVQHGITYQTAEIFVNIGFVAFLITWITNRLYWFPIKVIYMASIQLELLRIHVPFMTLLVTMLWIILFMNFYWFSFAIRLLYKVATGQIDELEDSREYNQQQQNKLNQSIALNNEYIEDNVNSIVDEEKYQNEKQMTISPDQINNQDDDDTNESVNNTTTNIQSNYNLRQRIRQR